MALTAFLKKCPVYGETFKVFRKDSGIRTDDLMVLTRELMQSTPGSYRYEDISHVLWNKVEEDMKNSSAQDLEGLNAFTSVTPLGGMSAEQMRQLQQKQVYDTFIKKLYKMMEERPEKVKEAFIDAAEQIVQGKGKDILNAIADVTTAYNDYREMEKM